MNSKNPTRSEMLARLGMAPLAIGAFAALAAESGAATKMGKTPKSSVQYQTTPKGGAQCSTCRFYINNKKKSANGGCTQVAGSISPKAWCVVYNKGDNSKQTM